MSCRFAATASPTQDEGTNPVGGWRTTPQAHDAPCAFQKTNPVGGHSICPRPDRNYLFSLLFCNLQTFTIPQALSRQLPLHKGAIFVCTNLRVRTLFFAGRRLSRCGNTYPPACMEFCPNNRCGGACRRDICSFLPNRFRGRGAWRLFRKPPFPACKKF